MNRTPYRRVTPSNRSTGTYTREPEHDIDTSENISHAETLIMQCILCGVIMVVVLIASMVDIAPAVRLKYGIRQVLSGAETLDELITEVRQFGSVWLDMDFVPQDTTVTPEEFSFPVTGDPYEYNEEIYTGPPAADDQVSNLAVPEPPVTPGLWD